MAKQGKKKNGYKMPEPLPLGELLTDTLKNEWELGPSIGKGGFGEIYSARKHESKDPFPFVIKIEPHDNGPLFVEMHFYMRNCKNEDVEKFKQENKLKTLGMPVFIGSGSHEHNGQKYRFIVMEKYGTDIWKIFLEHNKVFPEETVLKLGIQIIDILEYIHSRGYVHADIKGLNLLLGAKKGLENQVFLLDYGLATHYFDGKVFKPDPKKAHDGTIEYLSVDSHLGVKTRRGDLEILLYNLIQWLGHKLPWENKLGDVKYVHESKEKYMKDPTEFMNICFGDETPLKSIVEYLKYIKTLEFNTAPDYHKIKNIFLKDLKLVSGSSDTKISFKKASPGKRKNNVASKPVKKTKLKATTNGDLEEPVDKMVKTSKKKSAEESNGATSTSEMLKYQKKIEEKKNKRTLKKAASVQDLSEGSSRRTLRKRTEVTYAE